jgi:hypothetical protein
MQKIPPKLTGTDHQAIEELTGLQPISCACKRCSNLCKRISCMGTPQEILALINAGYAERIRPAINLRRFPGYTLPDRMLLFIPLYDPQLGSCTFLKNDLCTLHDRGLKPIEGRLSDCKTTEMPADKIELPLAVLLTWLREENKQTIRIITKAISRYFPHDHIPLIMLT